MKILLLCEAQLGDILLLTPAIRALKQSLGGSRITVLLLHRRKYSSKASYGKYISGSVYEGTAQALQNNPDIDEILEIDRSLIRTLNGISRIKTEIHCFSEIRKRKFDTVICTFPQSRFIIWAFLSGIKERIGQRRQSLSWLLTKKPDIAPSDCNVLKYYCGLTEPLGTKIESYETKYYVSEQEKKDALNLLIKKGVDMKKKILLIHPGASEAHKIWNPVLFARVADHFLDNGTAEVIFCSSPYDKAVIDKICSGSRNNYKIFVHESVREFGAVISHSTVCLVNNSGPGHLAAAVGTKSISIFQKYDHGKWNVYNNSGFHIIESEKDCKFCAEAHCRCIISDGEKYGSECLSSISPETVINKIKEIL